MKTKVQVSTEGEKEGRMEGEERRRREERRGRRGGVEGKVGRKEGRKEAKRRGLTMDTLSTENEGEGSRNEGSPSQPSPAQMNSYLPLNGELPTVSFTRAAILKQAHSYHRED